MDDNNQTQIETFNQILIGILKTIYIEMGPQDMSASLEVLVKFDDKQRVSGFENLLVNGKPKIPSFELTEKVNEISTQLLSLPEKHWLKECKFDVKEGGQMDISPTYIEE